MRALFRIDLRRLILALSVLSTLIMLGNSIVAIYHVQQNKLYETSLQANQMYARKLADLSEALLHAAMRQLKYGAQVLEHNPNNPSQRHTEMTRLLNQSDIFNVIVNVNENGVVENMLPLNPRVIGARLTQAAQLQSLKARRPFISEPFISPAGNYVVSISHPLFSDLGQYRGYLAGSIYLHAENSLNNILGTQYELGDSQIVVMDRNRTVIYHTDPIIIGQTFENNPAINAALRGETGSLIITDKDKHNLMTGYAPVGLTGWAVIVQHKETQALASLRTLIIDILISIAPLGIVLLVLIWFASRTISRPLHRLAQVAHYMDKPDTAKNFAKTNAWYFEAQQIKHALLEGLGRMHHKIDQLHSDSMLDPLTGLLNRRGFDLVLAELEARRQAFSVLCIDIDHFKAVNDQWGHHEGDRVLKRLAKIMQLNARQRDSLCRVGGEEFLVFLPGISIESAYQMAERLRLHVQATPMGVAGHITISLGLAYWSPDGPAPNSIIKKADAALFQAKRQGRNQTVIST